MEYLCIIPARGGSNDVPHKNVKPLNGKPLIAWTIQQAIDTEKISRTIVSTDNHRIAKIGEAFGAEVPFRRPEKLAQDKSTLESVLLHCLAWLEKEENYSPDAVVLLQCTSPVRHQHRISQAIDQFETTEADSLVSVSPMMQNVWMESKDGPKAIYNYRKRPELADMKLEEMRYRENNSIYITRSALLKKKKNRLGGKVTLFKMDEAEGYSIDSEIGFDYTDTLMRSFARL